MASYWSSTRHPWSSFLFLAPLLVAYEGGVIWLGGAQGAGLRNGADAWFRWHLEVFGAGNVLVAPLAVIGLFLFWSFWRWDDRPKDPISVWFGMALESAIFAFLLWQLSQNFIPIVERMGIHLEIAASHNRMGQVLTYIGAGIYEEVLFRLGLFGLLCFVLRLILLPSILAIPLAAIFAALLFSAAHHLVPNGEPMNAPVFVFRVLAGLYFTGLYIWRGFGIAVGAHAGYDVLVGLIGR